MEKLWKKLKFNRFIKKRQVNNDKLQEAERSGLITKEELYRLRYERAKEDYAEFLKTEKKTK